ncbi:MAG: hypothetical protein GSR85_09235 [Desulfurococcales archaeon]|nr:hypothetical protein [Desulfurococcales archaeon]
MPREKLRVTVKWYTADTITIGGVSIGVLKPSKVVESVEIGDPIDTMLRIAEDNARLKKGDYFEVVVEGSEIREIIGETPRYRWSRPLFPVPSRLRRIGIVRVSDVKESIEGGFFTFTRDDVEWHTVEEEIYVYEGKLEAPSDVLFVILDTDRGLRMVKAQRVSMQKLSSQLHPQQVQVYSHSEGESNEGNSPS